MASSRYLSKRDAQRKELGKSLVSSIAGISEEDDPENAALALDFVLDHFARPQTSQLLMRVKDVYTLYEGIASKMHAHAEHLRAERMMDCLHEAQEGLDEDTFAAVASMLHMLSHAPSRTDLDEDARLLYDMRVEERRNQEDAARLETDARERLRLHKEALLQELQQVPDDLIDQDWLDEDFSSSSELSDFGSDDEEDTKFPPNQISITDVAKSVEKPDALKIQTQTSEDTKDEDCLLDDIWLSSVRRSAQDEELISTDVMEDQKPPTIQHFNATCYDACVRSLKERESLRGLGAESLVPGGRDHIVHEAELCRAMLLAFHGYESVGLVVKRLSSKGGIKSPLSTCDRNFNFQSFQLEQGVSLAHTSGEALANAIRPLLKAASALHEARMICLNLLDSQATLPLTFQRTAALISDIIETHVKCQITAMEKQVQQGAIISETTTYSAAERIKTAPTLISLSNDLRSLREEAKALKDAASLLSNFRPTGDVDDCRTAAKDLLNALFDRALDEFTLQGNHVSSVQPYDIWGRIFRAAMASQTQMLGQFFYEGRLSDPFREFFLSVDIQGGVILHAAPRAWQPMCERIFMLCDAIEMLRRLGAHDGPRGAGWPPWPLEVGQRALNLHRVLLAETPPARVQAPGTTDDESHMAVALLGTRLFAPLNDICTLVNQTVMREHIVSHRVLEKLAEMRALFFVQNELSLQAFLRDVYYAADRDLPSSNPVVAEAMNIYLEEFMEDTRLPPGCLTPAASPTSKYGMDDEQRSETLTHLLHADLEDHLQDLSKDQVHVVFESVPGSERFQNFGVRALTGMRLVCDIPPPLDSVVDGDAHAQYQAVFRFLVLIKRTMLVLCRLQHNLRRDVLTAQKEGDTTRPYARMHKVNLMLIEHLHFISNLHAFVMHRLADVSWTQFTDEARKATRIDLVYDLHRAYLRRVCIQCLISPDTPNAPTRVMEAVHEMLECSLHFRVLVIALWQNSQRNEEQTVERLWKSLSAIHAKFTRASRFLLIMLSQRASLGGAKHLEDVLTRLDFNQACRRKRVPAKSTK